MLPDKTYNLINSENNIENFDIDDEDEENKKNNNELKSEKKNNEINQKINKLVDKLSTIDDENSKIKDDTFIYWGDEPVGKLKKGNSIYKPIADALNSEYLSSETKLLVSAKLQKWLDNEITETLQPLVDALL